VSCLSPEVQAIVHNGYKLGEKDYRELYLLRDRFAVDRPDTLLKRVLSTRTVKRWAASSADSD
jgi:hypothetical protein